MINLPMTNNLLIGQLGENIASKYLIDHGFQIIDRNWKVDLGEIDIVAIKNNTSYFVEVKTQFENQSTQPEDELTRAKINKLRSLSRMYVMSHKNSAPKMMLAAVCIILMKNDGDIKLSKIRFIENILE